MLLWLSPQHTPSTRWCLAPSSALTRTIRPGVISTAYYISDFCKETCLEHSQRGRGAPWLLWMGEVCKTCSTQYSVRHLFLIGVLGNFKCSATSSLTTAWSGQVGRRERWLSTSLFDTWSVPSTNSAESGDFPSSFKGSLWSHLITNSSIRVVVSKTCLIPGSWFERKFQVRKEEASYPTSTKDCHSLWRPPGNTLWDLMVISTKKHPPIPSDMDSARGNKNHLPLEGQGQDQTQEKAKALETPKTKKLFRWSQIMYMYYFLGHQLMDNPSLTDAQKEVSQRKWLADEM